MKSNHSIELVSVQMQMREISFSTLKHVSKRALDHPDYPWFDMKCNPIDGSDWSEVSSIRSRDCIYGWIQGRGLETVGQAGPWLEQLQGYNHSFLKPLYDISKQVYTKLKIFALNRESVPWFMMSPALKAMTLDSKGSLIEISPDLPEGFYSLSDIFVARGLLAYASSQNLEKDIPRMVSYLRAVIDSILDHKFKSDQIMFDSLAPAEHYPGVSGNGELMLALGGASLLLEAIQEEEDRERGYKILNRLITKHLNREPGISSSLMIDLIDSDGNVFKKDGRIHHDPGHALETVGVALQFLQTESSCFPRKSECKAPGFNKYIRVLKDIAFAEWKVAYKPGLGITKSLDGETLLPINSDMPWWSLCECVRTFGNLYYVLENHEEKKRCLDLVAECLKTLNRRYISPSDIGLPVPTIDKSGAVVDRIPATPDLDGGFHTALPFIYAYKLFKNAAAFEAGFSETPISPPVGGFLQGHIARDKPSQFILDELFCHVLILKNGYEGIYMISLDLIEFDSVWLNELKEILAKEFHLPAFTFVISATHTHTGPPVIDLGSQKKDKIYLEDLTEKIITACYKAEQMMVPVEIAADSYTVSGTGINRRVYDKESRSVAMKPNYNGAIDEIVNTLYFIDKEGDPLAILSQFALHPTTLGTDIYMVSADYPGRIASYVYKQIPTVKSFLPLQGACGDTRPALIRDDLFYGGSEVDINTIGERYGKAIVESWWRVKSDLPKAILKGKTLNISILSMDLPFSSIPSEEDLNATIHRLSKSYSNETAKENDLKNNFNESLMIQSELFWARQMLQQLEESDKRQLEYSVQTSIDLISIGDQISIVTVPGELFSEIAQNIRSLIPSRFVLIVAYANGSLGYLPTAEAFSQGGYEVETAYKFYGFPGPWAQHIENIIYETVKKGVNQKVDLSAI